MRRAWVGAAAALGLVLAGGGLARSLPSHRAADAATMAATTGQQRTYYIAAEEVLLGLRAARPQRHRGTTVRNDAEKVFVENGPTRVGHVLPQSLYRGYTDATFTHRTPVPTRCPPA